MTDVKISTALLSVSDKHSLVMLGTALSRYGTRMLSTGGTFRTLVESGLTVEEVSAYTGFPEMMDGRVKTLHPRVHGGLLGRLEPDKTGQDAAVMSAHGIEPIDLLIVNLYPFEATVANPGVTLAEAIENIDIGGPAMLRSAAKNFDRVAVVVDPTDYSSVVDEMAAREGALSLATRFRLAVKAFGHVAHYDVAIANYLAALPGNGVVQ